MSQLDSERFAAIISCVFVGLYVTFHVVEWYLTRKRRKK